MKQKMKNELYPTKEWTRSTPSEQGLDDAKINKLIKSIKHGFEYPDQDSLLIVKNGHLVVEEYFRDCNERIFDEDLLIVSEKFKSQYNTYFKNEETERIHTLQSATKSFASALVGIAIDRGEIKSVDEKMLSFFPEFKNMDDRKSKITLKDLLTMRSGTDYGVGGEVGPKQPHEILNNMSEGWTEFYLNRPMVDDPGTKFVYDSGAVILVSAILEKVSGMHAEEYAEKHLFEPLGIKDWCWYANKEGHTHAGGGLCLRPLDMAKFGLLYLQKGRWGEKQIISESWVEESTKNHQEVNPFKDLITFAMERHQGYGYYWWILDSDICGNKNSCIYAAAGAGGQFIFVVPEHNMVVVATGNTKGMGWQKAIDFLYTRILPAVKK